MFLKKTPKAKGTYLAITESYYDKEKKATRQKTIMGLGYLEDLKKDYPDPISHFLFLHLLVLLIHSLCLLSLYNTH